MSDTRMTAQDQAVATRDEPRSMSLMEVVAAAARDPHVDVAKMQQLLEMSERIQEKEAEREFNQAMSRLRTRLPTIPKTRKIEVKGTVRSHYAAYEDIDAMIRPLLSEEGFSTSYTSKPTAAPIGLTITIKVAHRAGHSQEHDVFVPFDKSEYRSDAQSWGSTLAYGKRYALCAAFDIITKGEDNDGAGGFITETQAESIMDMIAQCSTQQQAAEQVKSGFLSFMGAKSVRDIYARDYRKAIATLEAKRRKVGQ